MNFINITTTSCCRYKLLHETYASFTKNLKGIDFKKSTLFLNLDYYKEVGNIKKSIKVAESFFGNVIYNVVKEPNFAKAVKWCWQQKFKCNYVLHLEEDWELFEEVSIENMISILQNDPEVVSVRLKNRGRYKVGKTPNIVLSPSLFRKDFLHISKFIKSSRNPERSIKNNDRGSRKKIKKYMGLNDTFSYICTNPDVDGSVVRDIGRGWTGNNGFSLKKRDYSWTK